MQKKKEKEKERKTVSKEDENDYLEHVQNGCKCFSAKLSVLQCSSRCHERKQLRNDDRKELNDRARRNARHRSNAAHAVAHECVVRVVVQMNSRNNARAARKHHLFQLAFVSDHLGVGRSHLLLHFKYMLTISNQTTITHQWQRSKSKRSWLKSMNISIWIWILFLFCFVFREEKVKLRWISLHMLTKKCKQTQNKKQTNKQTKRKQKENTKK